MMLAASALTSRTHSSAKIILDQVGDAKARLLHGNINILANIMLSEYLQQRIIRGKEEILKTNQMGQPWCPKECCSSGLHSYIWLAACRRSCASPVIKMTGRLLQASHFASLNGWSIADPADVSFHFETWHLELVAGLVILISSSRYILLQTWSDFRDSSEPANRQILTSLEPLDYIVIACLPRISEELLFQGVLMPIFTLNWISAPIIGALFGVLHLGNGRRYSFAIWATFVGFDYGIETIISSSIIVPMASHSINNILLEVYFGALPTTHKKKHR